MEPRFIELPEKKVVGLGAKFISILSADKTNMAVIPQLWGQFMGRFGSIRNKKSDVCYGVVEDSPGKGSGARKDELFYIACVEVSDFGSVPQGMIHRTVPAGRYAVFTHKGVLGRLGQTMKFIYESWLPKAPVKLRDAPEVEMYDERFVPNSENSEFDILLPIR